MKVWLIYDGYDDGATCESASYEALIGVVDSEEKANTRILKEATDALQNYIDELKKNIDEFIPHSEDNNINDSILQDMKDELYFYDVQLLSLKIDDKKCTVYDSDGYDSHTYYYEVREVE